MAITVHIQTAATAIAGLTVSGVTIKDITAIPTSAALLCPILIPSPQYVSNVVPTVHTTGGYPAAKIDLNYTLNYIYLHCDAGSGMSQLEIINGLMTNFSAIIAAIVGNNILGLIDIQFNGSQEIGIITDPAGNEYWGVMFSLRVQDMVQ
jgi:hypothetical protein